jgi:hypothetical protein
LSGNSLKVVGGNKLPVFASNHSERWTMAKTMHISFLVRYLFEKFSWREAMQERGPKSKKHCESFHKVDGTYRISFHVFNTD